MTDCENCNGTGYEKNKDPIQCKMCDRGYCIYCKATLGFIHYPYIDCTMCYGSGYQQ